MLIEIERFRYYQEYTEFEFEEGKLNLLTGPSGTGKSTIFAAIHWCLYGYKKSVAPKKMKPTNANPTMVRITLDCGIQITRTKPPDTLSVILADDTELIEESADEWIINYFGSEGVFLATTYMKQKKENPLLELANAKKMILLREITFGHTTEDKTTEDPDYYTEKVTNTIKETKDEMLGITGRISILNEQYETMKKQNKKNISIWNKSEKVLEEETIKELEKTIKNNETNIQSLKKKIHKYRKEWETYDLDMKRKDYLTRQKETLRQKRQEIKYDKQILNQQIENLNIKKQYDKQKSEIEKNKPDDEICKFLEENSAHINTIEEFLTNEKEYRTQLKKLNLNKNITSQEIKYLIKDIENQIQNIENEELKYKQYESEYKNYKLMKKQHEKWEQDKNECEEAKNEYDNFYNNEDLIAIKTIIDKEQEDINTKDFLKKYYSTKTRFNKIIEILQKIIYDAEISEALLQCPKCSTSLEIVKHEHKKILIESKNTPIDKTIKKIAEKGIKVLNQLDALLSNYQSKKDYGDEPEIPIKPTEFIRNENYNISDLKKKLRILENLHYPDINDIHKLINNNEYSIEDYSNKKSKEDFRNKNYSIEDYQIFVDHNENFVFYKRGLETLKKYSKFKISIPDMTSQQAQNLLTEISSLDSQIEAVDEEYENLNISKPSEVNISELEKEIEQLESENKTNKNLAEIGSKLLQLSKLEIEIDAYKDKIEELTKKHTKLDRIKQIIAETGSHAMEDTVETLNSILQDICLSIFNNDTQICISMFKEFKTKDYLKPQPNVIITRGYEKPDVYDFDDELCGGEQSRISLALSLAFASIGTTPFLFIDEGFSSMDSVLIDKCLKVLKKYCVNKTIINVAHGINEGIHDNKVEIEYDDF